MLQRGFAFPYRASTAGHCLEGSTCLDRVALPFLCAVASLFPWLLISCLHFQVHSPATAPRPAKLIDAKWIIVYSDLT